MQMLLPPRLKPPLLILQLLQQLQTALLILSSFILIVCPAEESCNSADSEENLRWMFPSSLCLRMSCVLQHISNIGVSLGNWWENPGIHVTKFRLSDWEALTVSGWLPAADWGHEKVKALDLKVCQLMSASRLSASFEVWRESMKAS